MSEEVRICVAGELVQRKPVTQLALAQYVLKALMHIRVIPVSHLQPDSLHISIKKESRPKSAVLGREGMEDKLS